MNKKSGALLISARVSLGLSSEQMAQRFGIEKKDLEYWETGLGSPPGVLFSRIMSVAGIDFIEKHAESIFEILIVREKK